jgi:hypothetical protein
MALVQSAMEWNIPFIAANISDPRNYPRTEKYNTSRFLNLRQPGFPFSHKTLFREITKRFETDGNSLNLACLVSYRLAKRKSMQNFACFANQKMCEIWFSIV